MKKKTKTKTKSRSQVVHAYQTNPYALQRRNASAAAAPYEQLPQALVLSPPKRRFARARKIAKARLDEGRDRLKSREFIAEAGLTAGGAVVAALATGWLATKGWSPLAVGGATAVIGGAAAVLAPGAFRSAGLGVTGWGVGQMTATLMQQHALKELQHQKELEEQKALEQKKLEQQRALEQAAAQRTLPAPVRPSNAAFMPAISDAFSNSRTYGHYGRADDEDRMTDLDLVLG